MDNVTPQEYRSIDVTKFPLSVCQQCASVVATTGRDAHNRWHTRLDSTYALARSAFGAIAPPE